MSIVSTEAILRTFPISSKSSVLTRPSSTTILPSIKSYGIVLDKVVTCLVCNQLRAISERNIHCTTGIARAIGYLITLRRFVMMANSLIAPSSNLIFI